MSDRLEASAPLRVDLAGGWTDVAPYPSEFGGEVVNFAINRRVWAQLERGGGRGDAECKFEAPRGSGLGTSGAMNVAIAGLLSVDRGTSPQGIAEMAFEFESEGGHLCGRQDQWASSMGGFNHLLFIGDSVEMMPFEPMRSSKLWLNKHLVIAYSGKSRNSGDMQRSVWARYSQGDQAVVEGLHTIRAAVRPMANGLQQDRRDMVVNSLREICVGVDMIDPAIHDPFRGVINPLLENGSIAAWKALGAGGGGCAALLCSPAGRAEAIASVEQAGWDVIEWDYENSGLVISE